MTDNWPGRGLITASVAPDGALVLGCDCGTTTHVTVAVEGAGAVWPPEIAITCDGCQTVRWFPVSPGTAASPGGET